MSLGCPFLRLLIAVLSESENNCRYSHGEEGMV